MKKRLCVDVSIIESLTKFIETEGVEIDLTQDDGSDADVLVCDDRKESDLDTLYSGGWIKCRTALNMARGVVAGTRGCCSGRCSVARYRRRCRRNSAVGCAWR